MFLRTANPTDAVLGELTEDEARRYEELRATWTTLTGLLEDVRTQYKELAARKRDFWNDVNERLGLPRDGTHYLRDGTHEVCRYREN